MARDTSTTTAAAKNKDNPKKHAGTNPKHTKKSNHPKKKDPNGMSLFASPYAPAAKILTQILVEKKSLKKLVYKKKSSEKDSATTHTGTQEYEMTCTKKTYAQVCQVLLYKSVLDMLLNETNTKALRNQIRHMGLLYVLVYELLLGPNQKLQGGGAAKRCVLQYESPLRTALTKNPKIKAQLEKIPPTQTTHGGGGYDFPRYARVNTLLTTLSNLCQRLQEANNTAGTNQLEFYVDPHVPNLLVFPPSLMAHVMADTTTSPNHKSRNNNDDDDDSKNKKRPPTSKIMLCLKDMIQSGELILQDKSSCFSALCLVHSGHDNHATPSRGAGDYLDACAAPGNKTQHLATLVAAAETAVSTSSKKKKKQTKDSQTITTITTIHALDRSPERLESLSQRMQQLVPSSQAVKVNVVTQLQDFLATDPQTDFSTVQSILLDPSCSGSGIYTAPERWTEQQQQQSDEQDKDDDDDDDDDETDGKDRNSSNNTKRIESLAGFQEKALVHAMSFPSVTRVVYSTCSLHDRENEVVVQRALAAYHENKTSADDDKRLWQVVAPKCLEDWPRRGHAIEGLDEQVTKAMIRATCDDETNGFFVCVLQKAPNEPPKSNKKGHPKSGAATTTASLVVVPEGMPLYNGQFAKQSSSVESKETPVATTTTTTATAAQKKKKKGKTANATKESTTATTTSTTTTPKGSVKSKRAAKIAQAKLKASTRSGTKVASDNQDKPVPKKVGKKLAWKKRQMEQKEKRLLKPPKTEVTPS